MDLDDLVRPGHAVRVTRTHPHRGLVARLTRDGALTRVLPGTYVRTTESSQPFTLARALCAYDPLAVLTGRTACAFHLTHERWRLPLEFTSPHRWTIHHPWFRARRGTIPPELVRVRPIPHVDASTAALQLATDEGAGVVDRALRRRRVTPESLQRAVAALAHTDGNAARRRIVAGSLERPWCAGEREFHALLRRARIRGWVGNHQVVAMGECYIIDVAFDEVRVGIEIDDWDTHRYADRFEADRYRHNDLMAAGWNLMHLTDHMVFTRPKLVLERVRRALATARAVRGLPAT